MIFEKIGSIKQQGAIKQIVSWDLCPFVRR